LHFRQNIRIASYEYFPNIMSLSRENRIRSRKNNARTCIKDIYDDDINLRLGPLITTSHYESLVDLEIEEDNVDLVIDAVCSDLLMCYTDFSLLKRSHLVRKCIKSATSRRKPYFAGLDCTEEDIDSVASSGGSSCSSNVEVLDHYDTTADQCWVNTQRNIMKATQEPLRMTLELCDFIRGFPERDVTLYIRLDEQVPKDSCTAYEVDWNRFHHNDKNDNNADDNETTDFFRIFRWCSREEKTFSRAECILGTFASACMHPYTLIVTESGTTITTKNQQKFSSDDVSYNDTDFGKPAKEDPFRPNRVLLDHPEDVCTAELRYYFNRMGVAEVQEVQSWLREIHDTADLDFFPDDPTMNNELLEDPYTDIRHRYNDEDMPFFLAGNVVGETQGKDSDYSMNAFLTTTMPFICVDEPCSELEAYAKRPE
jgi:hypothetical protein